MRRHAALLALVALTFALCFAAVLGTFAGNYPPNGYLLAAAIFSLILGVLALLDKRNMVTVTCICFSMVMLAALMNRELHWPTLLFFGALQAAVFLTAVWPEAMKEARNPPDELPPLAT